MQADDEPVRLVPEGPVLRVQREGVVAAEAVVVGGAEDVYLYGKELGKGSSRKAKSPRLTRFLYSNRVYTTTTLFFTAPKTA